MSLAVPATDVTADGTSLRTLGTNFRSRWGWENTANVRGRPLTVAYQDGGLTADGGLDPKILGLDFLIWGRDRATGYVTTDPWEHLDDNLHWAKDLFGTGEVIDFRFVRPNGDIHQAYNARVVDSWEANPTERGSPILRARIPLWVPEGTLRDITGGAAGESDATNTNLTGSGNISITTGGNARTSPRITVTADTLTQGLTLTMPDGAGLAFTQDIPATQDLVFDTGFSGGKSVTLDGAFADAGLQSQGRRAYWGYLEPGGANSIAYASTAGQFDITVDWYNRIR